jgi:glucose 1-dehydrogenase
MRFDGKSVLVTGAARGIGAATAIAFAKAGADVAVNDVSSAAETVAEIERMGGRALFVQANVADVDAVETMVAKVAAAFGKLDILVANAAYSERAPFWQQSLDAFQKTLNVTMMGPFYCVRAATRQMIQQGHGGSIVVTGSPHCVEAVPDCMAYNMAKAALVQLVKTAAIELFEHRIRVNMVQPGWTNTPGERRFYDEAQIIELGKQLPAKRLAHPEEIARGILFMASDESEYINASILPVDGGILLPWARGI